MQKHISLTAQNRNSVPLSNSNDERKELELELELDKVATGSAYKSSPIQFVRSFVGRPNSESDRALIISNSECSNVDVMLEGITNSLTKRVNTDERREISEFR